MNLGLGGMLVVKDKNLFSQIKKSNEVIPNLNSIKIVSVVFQLFAEAYLCKPNLLRFYGFYTKLRILCQKIFKLPSPFLDEDYGSTSKCLSYPYPAKIPNLIAKIGIKQIQNLPSRIFDRKAKVSLIVNKIENNFALTHSIDYNKLLPNVNFLRLIYVSSDVESDINKLKKILNKNDFWFNSPVIAREDNLEDYNYHFNSCKNAEFVSEHIINIPIPDSMKSIKKLLRLLNKL
jgi:dTDP-4-amino-4,6-dideoxygalactose transaminase